MRVLLYSRRGIEKQGEVLWTIVLPSENRQIAQEIPVGSLVVPEVADRLPMDESSGRLPGLLVGGSEGRVACSDFRGISVSPQRPPSCRFLVSTS